MLEITAALERDQETPLTVRHQRDREIAHSANLLPLPSSRADQMRTVQRWWQTARQSGSLATETNDSHTESVSLDRARTAGALLLFAIGCLLGCGVAMAALRYDGSAPVNLVSVLGVLVAIPLLLLLLTLLLLPGRVRGFGWLQDVLATFSPGQWLSAWLNGRFASADLGWRGRWGRSLNQTMGISQAAPGCYRRVAKWQLVLYSQWLALGFFVAALVTIVLLVTFSDLAFGWSTTLDVATARVVDWVAALAAPWSGWLAAASPDPALVNQSRFYRAAELTQAQVQGLGAWWPFLLAAVATYGLLPRLLLALLAGWRLRAAERSLLLDHPQVQRLFERLGTPVLEHQVDQAESAAPEFTAAPTNTVDADVLQRYQMPAGTVALVNWNDALPPEVLEPWIAQHMDHAPEQSLTLGARVPLAEQEQLLAALQVDAVVVLTKAWEPPLLELLDVTQQLKNQINNAGPVLLLPLGIDGARAAPVDLAIWRNSVAKLDDVRIRIWGVE